MEQSLDGRLTRAELSARVSQIWRIRDLSNSDRLPGAIFDFVRARLSDDYWVDDATFARTVRDTSQALA